MPRSSALAAATAALVLLTTGCQSGSDSDSEGESAPTSLDGLTVSGDFGKKPKVEVDDLDVAEPETIVPIEGDGEELADDDSVQYRFMIAKGTDGESVSENYREDEPQRMVIAEQPEVIADAVTGATVGSRVVVAMPVQDLLGEQGAPNVGLEPDDDLVMIIDLIELAERPLSGPEGDEVEPPADAPAVVQDEDGQVTGLDFSDAPQKAPSKLQVIPLVEGTGDPVKQGDEVTVDYYGAVWGNEDKAFDESYSRDPATFGLTEGGLIDGWVQGLDGVDVGSRVMLVIPPKLGYGKQGAGEDIPPNSTLVFVVDVLGANL